MEAVKVSNLSVRFGGVCAVNDVCFGVQPGERVAIIGPNGAGKTTLFNLINGQLAATEGTIRFFDQDVTNMQVHDRAQMGIIRSFQLVSLFLNLSVYENALLALHGNKPYRFRVFRSIYRYRDVSEQVERALKSVNLWQKRNELVKNISYGEQRKLEIGLSLAYEPRLLMLDEPSNGLTAGECQDIIRIINGLDRNITVIMVAHDMELVFRVAERIIVLHYGQVIADASPSEIRRDSRVREIYMGLEGTA